MKDKLKGLVLGLSIGVMMTGSIAYASGTQIEVYFKNIKYMFDGQEKKPADESFIYNGTTYVPLRFVSEALGKEVQWDGDTETVWVGKKVDLTANVAVYKGGNVTLGEFEKYAAIMGLLAPPTPQQEKEDNYKTSLVKQLIAHRILFDRLNEQDKALLPADADKELVGVMDYLKKPAGNTDIDAFLASKNLTRDDIKQFWIVYLGAQRSLEAPFTEDKLKSVYDDKVSRNSEDLITASVRHILIQFKDPKGAERTKEEVDKKVKEVQDKLNSGEDFAAVAKEYSEDPGSAAQGGLYENAAVSSWVEGFKKAAIELPLNQVSQPVETEYGYHIIRVEARSVKTFEQVKNELKQQLPNEAFQQLLNNELPGLIESINLPK